MRYFHPTVVAVAVAIVLGAGVTAQQQQRPPEKSNMELVGYDDLQGRSAYQPVVQKQGERFIAYVGHHGGNALNPLTGMMEPNGTSIVDVTNPKQPKYLAHIPGSGAGGGEAGGAQMVRVCSGSDLPRADKSKVYLLRSFGTSGHETWDVTDPAKPSRLAVVVSGLRDTHKNWWECDSGVAYLVSGDPAWHTMRMLKIYDLSDPAKPVFIRDFGLSGQQPSAAAPGQVGTGHFQDIHGPVSTGPKGNRVYIGYGYNGNAILQIVDRNKLLNGPKEPTDANLVYPQVSRLDMRPEDGAHTVLPLLGVRANELSTQRFPSAGAAAAAPAAEQNHDEATPGSSRSRRDFAAVIGEESGSMCSGERQLLRMVDITTETKASGVSTWSVPDKGGDFCGKGGRFGPHSSNENNTPIYYNRVLFVAYFNAGVRALDIRDPFHPQEIGYFIPAPTSKTSQQCAGRGAAAPCKVSIQTNNVDVDDRGYVYTADRANTGMHILELAGPARRIANFP